MTTETKVYDVAEVRELLVRAVEEKGADYVYVDPDGVGAGDPGVGPSCVNWDADGNPSCIAGHVFVWLGINPNPLHAECTVFGVNEYYSILTRRAELALIAAQTAQDTGKTWGEALAAFDKVVAES